ncbi:hypothetical protein BJG01_00010 [Vibrio splendidus]|nr:hypothetical protein BJG01_00010 [Vibrio splendidus]
MKFQVLLKQRMLAIVISVENGQDTFWLVLRCRVIHYQFMVLKTYLGTTHLKKLDEDFVRSVVHLCSLIPLIQTNTIGQAYLWGHLIRQQGQVLGNISLLLRRGITMKSPMVFLKMSTEKVT